MPTVPVRPRGATFTVLSIDPPAEPSAGSAELGGRAEPTLPASDRAEEEASPGRGPAGAGRRRRRKGARLAEPMTLESARAWLFRPATLALVLRWLLRLGVPLRDRRDVAQDVMAAAHQSFPNYDPKRARPERWLNAITVYTAAHYRDRARHRREELTDEAPEQASEAPDVTSQIEAVEERQEFRELIVGLRHELRGILALLWEGLSMQEIAAQEGIPLSTAYKWRARALRAAAELAQGRPAKKRRRPARPRKRGDR